MAVTWRKAFLVGPAEESVLFLQGLKTCSEPLQLYTGFVNNDACQSLHCQPSKRRGTNVLSVSYGDFLHYPHNYYKDDGGHSYNNWFIIIHPYNNWFIIIQNDIILS